MRQKFYVKFVVVVVNLKKKIDENGGGLHNGNKDLIYNFGHGSTPVAKSSTRIYPRSRCEVPAERQLGSGSGGSATWSGGDSALPL